MKQIIHTIELALVAVLLSGCIEAIGEPEGAISMPGYEVVRAGEPVDVYHLHISFKDTEGTDLLEKLAYYKSDPTRQKYWGEIDPALYSLNIIATSWFTPQESFFTLSKYDENHSWITPDENGYYGDKGTWYLTSKYVYPSKTDGSPYNPLKYRMSCETLFDYSYA